MEQLQQLADAASTQRINRKFDTGVHRRGIAWERANDVVALLKKSA